MTSDKVASDTERPTCPVCERSDAISEAPEAGYWICSRCGERGSGLPGDVNWWRNDPDSIWYVASETDHEVQDS